MFVRGLNETTDLDYSDEATRTVTSSRTLIKARPHMWDGRNSFLQLVVAILGSGIYCCICLINRTLTCLSASLFFQYFSDSSPAENLGRGAEIEQSTTIQIFMGSIWVHDVARSLHLPIKPTHPWLQPCPKHQAASGAPDALEATKRSCRGWIDS